jgi:hypothetical protein
MLDQHIKPSKMGNIGVHGIFTIKVPLFDHMIQGLCFAIFQI